MARTNRTDTRGRRPDRDGRTEPARRIEHHGRRVPAPTATAPVRRSGVPSRRWDVSGPPAAFDPPTAEHVTRSTIEPDGTVGAPRGSWERDTVAPDGSNPYGRGRTATVGATSRARSERRRQSAVAASRVDAARIAARLRAERDATATERPARGPRARRAGCKRRR